MVITFVRLIPITAFKSKPQLLKVSNKMCYQNKINVTETRNWRLDTKLVA